MTLLITILMFSLAPVIVAWIAYLAIDTYNDHCPIAIVGDGRPGCEHYHYRLRHTSDFGALLRRCTIGVYYSAKEWYQRVTSDGSAWYHGAIIGECISQRAVAVDNRIDTVLCSLLAPCYCASTKAFTYLASLCNGYTSSNLIDLVRGKVTHWISRVEIVRGYAMNRFDAMIDRIAEKTASRLVSDFESRVESHLLNMLDNDDSNDQPVKARKVAKAPKDDRTVKPSNDQPVKVAKVSPKADCTYTTNNDGSLASVNVDGDTYLIPSDRQITPDETTGLGASYRAGRGQAQGLYLGTFPNGNAAIYSVKTSKIKSVKSFTFDGSTDKWTTHEKGSNGAKVKTVKTDKPSNVATVNVDGHTYNVLAPDAQPTSGYLSIVVDGRLLVNSDGAVVRVKANTDKAKLWLSDPVSMLPSMLRPHINTAVCVRN